MSDRKIFSPRTRQQDQREIDRIQNDFSDGMYRDITDIPENAVADLKNMINRGSYLETRTGSRLWGDWKNSTAHKDLPKIERFPKPYAYISKQPLTDQTSSWYLKLTLAKSGTQVSLSSNTTDTVEEYFATSLLTGLYDFVGSYIVWPGYTTQNKILTYDSTTTGGVAPNEYSIFHFTIDGDDVPDGSYSITLRSKTNAFYFHKETKKVFIMSGMHVYESDVYCQTWTPWICESTEKPSNTTSHFETHDRTLFLVNSNGIFKFDLDDWKKTYYKINSSIPDSKIVVPDQATPDVGPSETATRTIGRKILYTMTKMNNPGAVDRATENVKILQESGTVKIDSDGVDYSEIWAANYEQNNAYITGLEIPTSYNGEIENHWTHYSLYATLDIGEDGKLNGNNSEVYVWWKDVPIARVMTGYTLSFPAADLTAVTIVSGASRKANTFDGAIAVITNGTYTFVTRVQNDSGTQLTINGLYNFGNISTPWRILLGFGESHVLGTESTETAIYAGTTKVKTLAASGAGSVVIKGFTASTGTLKKGTQFDLEGTVYTITANASISANDATVSITPVLASQADPDDIITFRSAPGSVDGILSSSVYSQTTPLSPSLGVSYMRSININDFIFSETDYLYAKNIYWEDGDVTPCVLTYKSPDPNTIKDGLYFYDPSGKDRTNQHFAIGPTMMDVEYLGLNDDTFRGRIDAGLILNTRFWTSLPNCSIGTLIPGFFVVADNGTGFYYYSQMPQGYEYITGYYYEPYQYGVIKDQIVTLTICGDNLIVWCKNSKYRIPLNITNTVILQNIGISYTVLTNQEFINDNGLVDRGAICKINESNFFYITPRNEMLIFDGAQDSKDLSFNKVKNDFAKMEKLYSIAYDPTNGILLWGYDRS
jgi:hypothetical protein